MDIGNYGLSEKYKGYSRYGDILHEVGKRVDWESLRPIFRDLYTVNAK